MRNGSMVLAGLFTVAALVGCGSSGGGGGGGGGFSTSVPSGTKLSSLTTAQAAQLCTDLTTYENKQGATLTTSSCKIDGILAAIGAQAGSTTTLTDAQLQAACTVGYSDCTSADAGTDSSNTCDSTTFAGEPSTCTATVSDVQKCAGDEITGETTFFASLPSCGALTSASLNSAEGTLNGDGGDSGLAEPASCTALEAMGCVANVNTAFIGHKAGGHRTK